MTEISVRELSEVTGIPVRKIMYRIVKTKEVKARKAGWFWLVPSTEVEKIKRLCSDGK